MCVCMYVCMYVCTYAGGHGATDVMAGNSYPVHAMHRKHSRMGGRRRVQPFFDRIACAATVLENSFLQAGPLQERSVYYVCTRKPHFGGPATRRAFRVLCLYAKSAFWRPGHSKSVPRTQFVYSKTAF